MERGRSTEVSEEGKKVLYFLQSPNPDTRKEKGGAIQVVLTAMRRGVSCCYSSHLKRGEKDFSITPKNAGPCGKDRLNKISEEKRRTSEKAEAAW